MTQNLKVLIEHLTIYWEVTIIKTSPIMSADQHCQNSIISGHDKAVLNRIFNPELPYSDVPEKDQLIEEGEAY